MAEHIVSIILISIFTFCIFSYIACKKKDKITKKINSIVKNSEKNAEFKNGRQNIVNNLINIYSSDVYDLEEILKRKNYLTSYKDVTACIASIMFSAFVIGFSNYIVYSIMLINNYDFSIENNLIATCSSIIVSLCICLWLYYIKVLFLSNDFDKYNTNAFEIALIDLYIEKNTGISTKGILDELENKISN